MGNKPVSKIHLNIVSSEGLRPSEIFIHFGLMLILFQLTGIRKEGKMLDSNSWFITKITFKFRLLKISMVYSGFLFIWFKVKFGF